MTKWKKLRLAGGAEYSYLWDDHCIVLKAGIGRIYLEPLVLPELIKIAWIYRVDELDRLNKEK
jgi:hypothetical protein